MFKIGMQDNERECPILWDSGRRVFRPEEEVLIVVRAPLAKILAEKMVVLLNGSLDLSNDVHLREQGHVESAALDNAVAGVRNDEDRYRSRWRQILFERMGICPRCGATPTKEEIS
jgi:hypothetical protein